MSRWKLFSLGSLALFLFLIFSFQASTQPGVTVSVTTTVDGLLADGLIKIFQDDQLVQVEYTGVHTPGRAEFQLTQGDYTLQIEHGAGFISLLQRREITVKPGSPIELAVDIKRLLDPSDDGYYSADLHVHTVASAPPTLAIFGIPNHGVTPVDQAVAAQLAAGLDVMFISDHNTAEGHEEFAQTARERGVPFLLSEEITTTRWGHFNAYSLSPGELVEFTFAKLPTEFFAEARANGAAMIQVNHPLNAIGGYFFVSDQPEYDPNFDAVEAFNGAFGDDDLFTVLRLFDFWNEGRRYVATAAADDHDWKRMGTQYGTPRTYAFVEGELSAEKFLDSLNAGRAFVSYGPLVVLSANGTAEPGATLQLDLGAAVTLSAKIESVSSLDGLQAEIVRNGQSVQSFELSGQRQKIVFVDTPQTDAWYVVRLLSATRKYLALTNPIWVTVGP